MEDLKRVLDQAVAQYNDESFIVNDPISIPKKYSLKQDIEITAFWTAMLSWGQRVTIINKATELFGLMGESPYDFIKNHQESDRKRFENFKHRTFQYTDTLYFLEFLQHHYTHHESLEDAFVVPLGESQNAKNALSQFHEKFFALEYAPQRTKKHIATPARKSSCKRLNMFLRWMVRKDDVGVDFGLWSRLKMSQLMIPLDVHVYRVASQFGLLQRKQTDWRAVEELTASLREFDQYDPVKYDFALFGIGILQKNEGLN